MARRHVLLGLVTLTGGVALAGGAVIGVAAGVGAVWHATNPSAAAPAASAGAAAASPKTSGVHLVIEDVKTPGGEQPAYVGPNGVGSPVLFQVPAGTSTSVTLVNKSDIPHTFTSTALGLNVTVPPGPATVHFTVDPRSAGKVSWQCAFPCGAWVMSHEGYMEGFVEVTA
jgi:hypothetical protein